MARKRSPQMSVPKPTGLVAYLRVSTDEQAESGLGLLAQRRQIEDAAKRLGVPVREWFEDAGLSGSYAAERRPGLAKALGEVGEGEALIVARRDRLARDVLVSCMIEKELGRIGARIISAAGEGTDTDSPVDQLTRRILDAFAEFERLMIGSRTARAMAEKRRKGEDCGGRPPFGYVRDAEGKVVKCPQAQETLNLIRSLRRQRLGYVRIARELTERGVPTPRGWSDSWQKQTVMLICRRYGL